MRRYKFILIVWLVAFSLSIFSGCLTQKKTRSGSIKPQTGQTQNITPKTSKKRTLGLKTVTEKKLVRRIKMVETAVKKDDWAKAKRETDALGIDMTKFSSVKTKGKSLRSMGKFDANYLKLQKEVRTKNKTAALAETKKLRTNLRNLK